MTSLPFTTRIHAAIDLAARVHESQYRKEPDLHTPFVAHVYGVALILARHGFGEDVIIAGLLHDVLEDQPGHRADVERFGPEVVTLVEWVTEQRKYDADGKKLPWAERKHAYNERMRSAPPEARAISAADKIHNMQSTLMVIERGHDPWAKLTGTRDEHLDRYRQLLAILRDGWEHPLLEHYCLVLQSLETVPGGSDPRL